MVFMTTSRLALCIAFVVISISSYSNTYHVSRNGDDLSNGLSIETPFKTIDKLNSIQFAPGDSILFERGGVYQGSLVINSSGEPEKPLYFGAYGTGDIPVLSGSVNISGFNRVEGALYQAKCQRNVEILFGDKGFLTIAREPNKGFYLMEGGGRDYLVDLDLERKEMEVVGATVRMRVTPWKYEYRKVTRFKNYKMDFDSILFNKPPSYHQCKKGYGYYLDGKKEFLDHDGEWYYSREEDKIFLISEKEVEQSCSLQGSYIDDGVVLKKGISNIHLESLAITGFINTGINARGGNENIRVKDCEFSYIGKLGILAEKEGNHFEIINNSFFDITGTATRLFEISNSLIENNQFRRIGLIPGYGVDGVNGAIGICIENHEVRHNRSNSSLSHHNVIRNNHVDSTGYMSVRMDGHNNTCEKNVFKNGLLTLNDGGLIHVWAADTSYTFQSIIRNNIFMNCIGYSEGTPSDHLITVGIYIDNRCKDMIIENNLVFNTGNGITLNSGTFRVVARNNTCYDTRTKSFGISQDTDMGNLHHNITNNVFFNKRNMKSTFSLENHQDTYLNPGYIDSNIYISPNEKFHLRKITVDNKWKNTREHTLEGWQETTGQDKNSVLMVPEKDGKTYPVSKLFVNESDEEKTYSLDPSYVYMDIYKEQVSGEITLPPRGHKILFYSLK
jgi:hypothetical protein